MYEWPRYNAVKYTRLIAKTRGEISEAQLQPLYWNQGWSQAQIAQQLGDSPDAVREAMRRFGIATRSPAESARLTRGVIIPESELRELYEQDELSASAVAG